MLYRHLTVECIAIRTKLSSVIKLIMYITRNITSLCIVLFVVVNIFLPVEAHEEINNKFVQKGTSKSSINSKYEVFIPTREWQEVKKGQPIPKGLHVRVNFETGITEAKLLDADESKNTAVLAIEEDVGVEESIDPKPESDNSHSYLREALRNIHEDYNPTEKSDNEEETIKKKFKTYEELKKDLHDINLLVKTDMEVMNDLMFRFRTATNEGRLTILTDLEDLVHQFDNAREFARLDGFTEIVYPSFNDTNADVRSKAMILLGSAVQSNPQVQVSALTSGSIQMLLRVLLLDKSLTVRSRALYALSCLIRNFPVAQLKMVTEGGLTVLAQVFDNKENRKLQVKVVTLLNDLLREKQSTEASLEETNYTSDELKMKWKQYNSFDLESKLRGADWCSRIPTLLIPEITKPDNDVVEKVTNAMLTLFNICSEQFNQTSVKMNLLHLETWYSELVRLEPDEYYTNLANVLTNLRGKLKPIKGEL